MLTYQVDDNALITYFQNGESFPDLWPWGTKAEAEDYAQRICAKYNSATENPDGVKYPDTIPNKENQ